MKDATEKTDLLAAVDFAVFSGSRICVVFADIAAWGYWSRYIAGVDSLPFCCGSNPFGTGNDSQRGQKKSGSMDSDWDYGCGTCMVRIP